MSKFDIKEYLNKKEILFTEEGKNTTRGWINLCCVFPFCSDTSNHLGINLHSKQFSCWKCGEKGSIIKLVKQIENCSWIKAKQIVKHDFQNDLLFDEYVETNYATEFKFPPNITKKFTKKMLKYIKSRKFNPFQLIKKYDLYNGGLSGGYSHRIIIPYFIDNEIVTFTAKDITGKASIPYKNYPKEKSILDAKNILYNLQNVNSEKAILVEGCFDVWRIGDGAIGTSGTKVTPEQLTFLSEYGIKKLFIMFDGEPEAIDEAYKVADLASGILKETEVIELDNGFDPCDLPKEDIQQIKQWVTL